MLIWYFYIRVIIQNVDDKLKMESYVPRHYKYDYILQKWIVKYIIYEMMYYL